jgi:hypothetical protein
MQQSNPDGTLFGSMMTSEESRTGQNAKNSIKHIESAVARESGH